MKHTLVSNAQLIASLALVALLFLLFPFPTYAAGSLYLSPASKTVSSGTRFSVAVRAKTGGEAVNAVQANLSYDAGKLDFISVSGAGSSFSVDASSGGGGGGISISRGIIGTGISGNRLVATITFQVKAGATGTAGVSFSGGSALVRGSDQANIVASTAGGTYTIAASQSSSSTTTQQLQQQIPTPTPTIPKDPLIIQNVELRDVSYQSAEITWKTNRPAISAVEYGLNDNYGLLAQTPGTTTDHTVRISSELLTPGVLYHFRVKSIDSDNLEVTSSDSIFKTKGVPLLLSLKDEKGDVPPPTDVTMLIYQEPVTKTIDRSGTVLFENATPGKQIVTTRLNNTEATSIITVKEPTDDEITTNDAEPQQLSVTVPASQKPLSWMLLLAGALIFLIAALAGFFIIKKLRASP